MTTIAANLEAMAGDSRFSDDWGSLTVPSKLSVVGHTILGMAGDASAMAKIWHWLRAGGKRRRPRFAKAEEIEALLPCLPVDTDDPRAFRLDSRVLDTLYRRAATKAGVDAHFHDLRAEALTRMARRVDVLTLARIAGHRDIRSLSVYYRESATDIAARLN